MGPDRFRKSRGKKIYNMVLRGILCTLPSLKAFAQAKEFINAVFLLKWRPLETSAEVKEEWHNAAAQQQNDGSLLNKWQCCFLSNNPRSACGPGLKYGESCKKDETLKST